MTDTNTLAGSESPAVPVDTPAEAQTPAVPPPADSPAQAPSDAPQEPVKNRAQERIEELARANRELRDQIRLRDDFQSKQQQPAVTVAPTTPPTLAQHNYDQDAWATAYASWVRQDVAASAQQVFETRRAEAEESQRQAQAETAFRDREVKAVGKLEDYENVVYSPTARITPDMAKAIRASEIGPELAYHLVKSGKDREISGLPAYLQSMAIGRIEAQLTAKPTPQVTKAPPPASPVGAGPVTPTTELRDDMSDAEWIAKRRAQHAKGRRG